MAYFLSFLLFAALIIAVAVLWSRLTRAEQRLEAVIDQSREKFRAIEARLGDGGESEAIEVAPDTDADTDVRPATRIDPAPEPLVVPENSPAPPPGEDDANPASAEPEEPLKTEPEPVTLAYEAPSEPVLTEPASAEFEAQAEPSHSFDFEDIFGRRLPIWAGGIALAIAGIFLVRYAIEAGLFTPAFRVIASFLFGFGLIGGAELAYRFEDKVADPRVRQALAGAGIATLFGAFYLAGTGYGLIGPAFAFVGLAAVTAGAVGLSFRFGLPCAILGLVGGFAAPVLVDSDSANVPLLALYLGLVTAGLSWTGVRQGHRWLGYAALGIGLFWGALMQLTGLGSSGDILSLGGYLIVLGTVLPAFLYDRKGPGALQIIAGAAATLQMAMIVAQAGFEPLTWGLYLLIGAALAALGWRYQSLRPGSAIAALVGFWLLSIWPDASTSGALIVGGAMAAIFLTVPLIHDWRGQAGLVDIGQIALGAAGLGAALGYRLAVVPVETYVGDPVVALCLVGLALFPLGSFVLHWRRNEALDTARTLLPLGSAYALALAALLLVIPEWAAPVAAGGLALAVAALLWKREAIALRIAAWTGVAIVAFALLATPAFEPEIMRLGDEGTVLEPLRAMVRWSVLLPALLALAAVRERSASRPVAEGLAAFFAYGTLAQVLPGEVLPLSAALGGAIMAFWKPERISAWAVFLVISLVWTLGPVLGWLAAGAMALGSYPFMVGKAVAPMDVVLRLAPAALLAAWIAARLRVLPSSARYALAGTPAFIGFVALHSLYKQSFGIASLFQFEHYGFAERSIWQVLLLLVGVAIGRAELPKLPKRPRELASLTLITVSLAHFAIFTLVLHNPLYDAQRVGPTPVANWLLLAYGAAIAAVIALKPALQNRWKGSAALCDAVVMALIAILAVSLLRQVFSGSLLIASAIGSTESLLLSLLGIALALGYLWWGSRTDQRSWRVGSLVLILLAVCKVFLIDAAGLGGLLRIASFMALGFSLIGIGWVYSRQLKSRPVEAVSAD